MILAELLDRATQASSGIAGAPSPQVDRDMTAYTIFPHAVRAVYRDHAKTGKHLENLTNEYMIEIDNTGVGTLPDDIFREYLDRSYLPRLPFASMVPWEDYNRYRYDNQLSYFAIRGGEIAFSGNVIGRSTVTATNVSQTITGDGSAAAQGDRFYLYDGTALIDATVASITGTTSFTIWGIPGYTVSTATAGTLYRGQDDIISRTFTLGTGSVSSASFSFSSSNAAFTTADEGRRLRAYVSNPLTPIIDARIPNITSATLAALGCKAISSSTSSTLNIDILYTPLVLQAVGIPALPTVLTDALSLSPEVAEDTIVRIASVLRGEIPLQALIEIGQGQRR